MKNGEYTLVVAPYDYPGKRYRERYAYEHHVVWWKRTGETLKHGYHIHHVNEDKRDNRFENLVYLTQAEHHAIHAPTAATTRVVCSNCGGVVTRTVRDIKQKRKNGQTDFYCNRRCMGAHFGRGRKKNEKPPVLRSTGGSRLGPGSGLTPAGW